jgi:hypothetical protein
MGVTVEIEKPGLLPDLVRRLSDHGCMTRAVDDRVCRVCHPRAIDAAEEWQELRFFLRAWQAQHGVVVSLRPERMPVAAEPRLSNASA